MTFWSQFVWTYLNTYLMWHLIILGVLISFGNINTGKNIKWGKPQALWVNKSHFDVFSMRVQFRRSSNCYEKVSLRVFNTKNMMTKQRHKWSLLKTSWQNVFVFRWFDWFVFVMSRHFGGGLLIWGPQALALAPYISSDIWSLFWTHL